jgi:hypothetical protein
MVSALVSASTIRCAPADAAGIACHLSPLKDHDFDIAVPVERPHQRTVVWIDGKRMKWEKGDAYLCTCLGHTW